MRFNECLASWLVNLSLILMVPIADLLEEEWLLWDEQLAS